MTTDRDAHDPAPLAPHVFQILLSLLQEDMHGYSILKDILRRSGGRTKLGTSTVYAALKRMADGGLLEEVSSPSDAESAGPPRQYYRITEAGKAIAREEGLRIRALNEMVKASALFDTVGRSAPEES